MRFVEVGCGAGSGAAREGVTEEPLKSARFVRVGGGGRGRTCFAHGHREPCARLQLEGKTHEVCL